MLKEALFRWKFWRIEAAQKRTLRAYSADRTKAQAEGKSSEDIARISDAGHHEWRFAEDEKTDLRSSHILQQARRLLIAIPEWSDPAAWEDGQTSYHRLTLPAQRDLIKLIRAEKKDRSEVVRLWLPAIFAGLSATAAAVSAGAAWIVILRK